MAKLFVGSLPFNMTDDSLLRLFSENGYQAVSARVITDRYTGQSRGFGFVELGPNDDGAKAIREFNGFNIEGRRVRRIGQQEVCTVEDVREPDEHILGLNPACETMYWIQIGSEFDSRVWAKESELELAE